MSGWLPIETAPRDGTPMLVWGIREGEVTGRYDEPEAAVVCCDAPHYRGNVFSVTATDAYSVTIEATHWAPIPPPPATAAPAPMTTDTAPA